MSRTQLKKLVRAKEETRPYLVEVVVSRGTDQNLDFIVLATEQISDRHQKIFLFKYLVIVSPVKFTFVKMANKRSIQHICPISFLRISGFNLSAHEKRIVSYL